MSHISEQDIDRLSLLARIDLSSQEKQRLTDQLGAILGYIAKLNEVDTDGVEPMANVTGLENIFRKDTGDIVFQYPLQDRKPLLIDQAPATRDGSIAVKEILKNR